MTESSPRTCTGTGAAALCPQQKGGRGAPFDLAKPDQAGSRGIDTHRKWTELRRRFPLDAV